MSESRRENSRRQREAILRAAVAVFSRKGFHKSNIEEIARRAQVGKGTIYTYFKNKSDLFAAAVTEGMETFKAKLSEELVSDLPFPQHFKQLVRVNVSSYLKYGDLTKIFNNELSNGIDRKTLRQIEQVRRDYLAFFADVLEDGHRRGYIREVDFRLAAVGLVGLLDSMCNHQLRNKDEVDEEQIFNTVYTLLSAGLIEERRRPPDEGGPEAGGRPDGDGPETEK